MAYSQASVTDRELELIQNATARVVTDTTNCKNVHVIPRVRSKQGRAALSSYAPQLWDKLPEYLKPVRAISEFIFKHP